MTWKSFQLDPDLPQHYDGTEQQYLAERKGTAPEQVAQMWDNISRQAKAEGIDFDFTSVVVGNSFPAHRFLHLAKSLGKGDAAQEAILSAHFEQGSDTGDVEVLVELAAGLDIDEALVRETMAGYRFTEDVLRDIAEARALGINGVPFFVIDRKYGISGAQPTELFAEALNTAWQEANPLVAVGGSPDGEVCGPDGCG